VYTELTLIAQYVFQIPTRLHCDIFTPRSAARPHASARALARARARSEAACQAQTALHHRRFTQEGQPLAVVPGCLVGRKEAHM